MGGAKIQQVATLARGAKGVRGVHFMVVLRSMSDDLPLLLTARRAEAVRYARKVDKKEVDRVCRLLSIDTTPCNISLYTFGHGRIVASEVMVDLTGGEPRKPKEEVEQLRRAVDAQSSLLATRAKELEELRGRLTAVEGTNRRFDDALQEGRGALCNLRRRCERVGESQYDQTLSLVGEGVAQECHRIYQILWAASFPGLAKAAEGAAGTAGGVMVYDPLKQPRGETWIGTVGGTPSPASASAS